MMDQNGYGVDYGDAYMEQEEEWEREGLLDPAWEKQQKKVKICHCFISFWVIFLEMCVYSELKSVSDEQFSQKKIGLIC